jgi:hypothetical protein
MDGFKAVASIVTAEIPQPYKGIVMIELDKLFSMPTGAGCGLWAERYLRVVRGGPGAQTPGGGGEAGGPADWTSAGSEAPREAPDPAR